MPQIMEITLTLPEGQRLHPSIGSVLHGALMEYAHEDFAAAMHRSGVRPFSRIMALRLCAMMLQPDSFGPSPKMR